MSRLGTMCQPLRAVEEMLNCSHKTVIVLDHGPLFASPCGEAILEAKGRQGPEATALHKSLWTVPLPTLVLEQGREERRVQCGVEGGLEYLRLVSDLFPESRALVRFVVSDFVGRNVTPGWGGKGQALDAVSELLAAFRGPDGGGDPEACSVLSGLSMAVEALSQATELQKAAIKRNATPTAVLNQGRVLLLTTLRQSAFPSRFPFPLQ